MKIKFCSIISCVLYLFVGAFAEDEIKRGTFTFMAFIYYQDEAVLGPKGGRFLQGAVLVRPSFLISASPESSISKDPLSKTLLARLGATVIDPNFTLNEDEEEQEQEVIQITRPYEHNSSTWWLTDISLLKTLQAFDMTNSVHFTQLSTKQEAVDKSCHVLIFKKKSTTKVRILTRLYVDMLPATPENCGELFVPETMRCATVQPAEDKTPQPTDFCQGNSGGPLICDTDVLALQTYVADDCKGPHLYQLLSPKKRFLNCGIDEKCDKESCHKVCTVIQKDAPMRTTHTTHTELYTSDTIVPISSELTEIPVMTDESRATVEELRDDFTTSSAMARTTTATTPPMTTPPMTTPPLSSTTNVPTTRPWPIERDARRMNADEADDLNRTVSVEARKVEEMVKSRYYSKTSSLSVRATDNIILIVFYFAYSFLCILS